MAADNITFCPACGKPMGQANQAIVSTAAPASSAGLADNVAGMLAYVTVVPAIAFLLIEPYNQRRFVRFHAFQSIFLCLACIAAGIGVRMLGALPVIGWGTLLLWPFLGLAELVVWVLCLIKAYQGQEYKLPVIGDLAEKQVGAPPTGQVRAA
jgi:uncharacterized membrane protein